MMYIYNAFSYTKNMGSPASHVLGCPDGCAQQLLSWSLLLPRRWSCIPRHGSWLRFENGEGSVSHCILIDCFLSTAFQFRESWEETTNTKYSYLRLVYSHYLSKLVLWSSWLCFVPSRCNFRENNNFYLPEFYSQDWDGMVAIAEISLALARIKWTLER